MIYYTTNQVGHEPFHFRSRGLFLKEQRLEIKRTLLDRVNQSEGQNTRRVHKEGTWTSPKIRWKVQIGLSNPIEKWG